MLNQELIINKRRFTAEVAMTQEELTKGLAGVTTLPRNHGMLFVLPQETRVTLDGSDGLMGLDIAYMDDQGKIIEFKKLDRKQEEFLVSESGNVKYMLQMPKNWFAANNIQIDDILSFMVKTPIWMVIDMMQLIPETMPKEGVA